MRVGWVIEGHFLQAISLLLVIVLFLVLFSWIIRSLQRKPQKVEEQSDPSGRKKYTDDDFIGLD